jgi:hypothetical protein
VMTASSEARKIAAPFVGQNSQTARESGQLADGIGGLRLVEPEL